MDLLFRVFENGSEKKAAFCEALGIYAGQGKASACADQKVGKESRSEG